MQNVGEKVEVGERSQWRSMVDTDKELLKDLDNVVQDTDESDSHVIPVSSVATCVQPQRVGEMLGQQAQREDGSPGKICMPTWYSTWEIIS